MRSAAASSAASLLCLAVAILVAVPVAQSQLAHDGPVKNIALSRTLQPYDVVSIRLNDTGVPYGNWDVDDHGVLTMDNMPIKSILEFAYDIKADQIVGLNGPVSSARFNVTAKVLPPDGGPPKLLPDANLQAMAILMLEERFHLKAHLEPKIMPVYDLIASRGGLKIKLSQDEIKENHWNINGVNTEKILLGKNISLTDLADELSDLAGRKVVNKTGLVGHADITLKWTDDVAAQQGGTDIISIFTAVEEQLGLRLQPSRGPVDTLVIDHVEMPSEN